MALQNKAEASAVVLAALIRGRQDEEGVRGTRIPSIIFRIGGAYFPGWSGRYLYIRKELGPETDKDRLINQSIANHAWHLVEQDDSGGDSASEQS